MQCAGTIYSCSNTTHAESDAARDAALARSYPERRHLKISFWSKLLLIVLAFCSIVAIAGLYGYCSHITPTGLHLRLA